MGTAETAADGRVPRSAAAPGRKSKVFGIGLSKTGTTSLTEALRILGYRSIHYPFRILEYHAGGLVLRPERVERFDACTDSPIARFFPELDAAFPGSKFILTRRRQADWLRSCERHHVWPGEYAANLALERSPLVRRVMQLHRDVFGAVSFDREAFAEAYARHESRVLDYFRDRPEDLLVMDICGGEGWERLCPFLGVAVPARRFPRKNVGASKVFKRTYRKYFWKSLSGLSP